MTKPWFSLTMKPDAMRKLSREQYYAQQRHLRTIRRVMLAQMPEPPDLTNLMAFGYMRTDALGRAV